MSLDFRLDRIVARADELRAMMSEDLGGEAFVKASKELAEIEPVVARVDDLRAGVDALAPAESSSSSAALASMRTPECSLRARASSMASATAAARGVVMTTLRVFAPSMTSSAMHSPSPPGTLYAWVPSSARLNPQPRKRLGS